MHLLMKQKEFNQKQEKRSTLLVFAITLHNIPEGLAVGIAFGAVANGGMDGSLVGALNSRARHWYSKLSGRDCRFYAFTR